MLILSGGKNLARSEVYTLEGIINQAVSASYDLEISKIDIEIAKTTIKEARAAYYPNMRLVVNSEYQKGLDNRLASVTTVGDQVIPAGTRYQTSVALSGQQTLFDFGIRKRQVQIAQKDVISKTYQAHQRLRDLKIKLLDLYTEALLNYKALKAHQCILELAQQLYQMKKRLHEAGTTSGVDVAADAILVAQSLDEIESDRNQLDKALADISYYTHQAYDSQGVELAELPGEEVMGFSYNALDAPEAMAYHLEIEKKEKEIELLKRQTLPRVTLYSYYNLYGFDPDGWSSAFRDISQRTFSVGVSIVQPVFDGFKNQAAIDRARLERRRLEVERDQKLAELKHQALVYQQEVTGYGVQLNTKATLINKTQDKLSMVKRLSEEGAIYQTQAIQEHIERIKKQVEAERVMIQRAAAALKFKTLSES